MLSEIHDGGGLPEFGPAIDPGIIDIKRLQMFYVAVRESGFAPAAQLLGVSPSAISHAMKSLEEELGCALFKRIGHQVVPTGAGIRLLPMVEDLLKRMSLMKSELAALHERSERLAFTISNPLQGLLQCGVLAAFRECFPGADLRMTIHDAIPSSGIPTGVDLGIDYWSGEARGLVRRDLFQEELHFHVAPFHPLAQRAKASLADLRQNLVLFPDAAARELVLTVLAKGRNPAISDWVLPNPQSALEMARRGQGLAVLPAWAARGAIENGSLVLLKLAGADFRRSCCAWWPENRPLTWIADVFLSLMADEFGK